MTMAMTIIREKHLQPPPPPPPPPPRTSTVTVVSRTQKRT